MGADEQCGGYSRHAAAFQRDDDGSGGGGGGWAVLAAALQADVARIATRNLGRDDRVVNRRNVLT
jgi:asparagine synthetase B (glutamine-hydrolysing)